MLSKRHTIYFKSIATSQVAGGASGEDEGGLLSLRKRCVRCGGENRNRCLKVSYTHDKTAMSTVMSNAV